MIIIFVETCFPGRPLKKIFFIIVTKTNFQIAIDIGMDIFNIFFTLNKRLSIKK